MKLNVGVPNSMKVAAMIQPWEGKLSGHDVGTLMAEADSLGYIGGRTRNLRSCR